MVMLDEFLENVCSSYANDFNLVEHFIDKYGFDKKEFLQGYLEEILANMHNDYNVIDFFTGYLSNEIYYALKECGASDDFAKRYATSLFTVDYENKKIIAFETDENIKEFITEDCLKEYPFLEVFFAEDSNAK